MSDSVYGEEPDFKASFFKCLKQRDELLEALKKLQEMQIVEQMDIIDEAIAKVEQP